MLVWFRAAFILQGTHRLMSVRFLNANMVLGTLRLGVFAVWIHGAAHRLLEQAIDLLTLFFDQRPCALLDSAEDQI